MLRITDLEKKFASKKVLKNINLELDNGIYGLLGHNGAGKTTLIRCITGVYSDFSGNITLDDQYKVSDKHYTDYIGYLPQSFGLFKDMKVFDMLMYLENLISKEGIDKKSDVLAALEKVNLSDKKDDKVKTLSGGMTRRLGIAQALLGNPRLIVFDEPTTGLDPEERVRFKNVIENIEKDKIVIISTHIVSDIERICDKVIVMDNGEIVLNGSLMELADKSPHKEASMVERLEEGFICISKE